MLIDILHLMGVIFCLLTAFLIRFRFNKNNSFSGHLLAAVLFLNALCNSFYLFIVYGLINHFPYLYKVPAPITYLIFPLAYLYVRAVLYGKSSFKKTDVLHLIPFLFFTVNYFPFYMMDMDEKSRMVYEVSQNFSKTFTGQDGHLPEWVNIFCRALISLIYLAFQWRMIHLFFTKNNTVVSKQYKLVKKWIYDFTTIQTIYSLALLVLYVSNALLFFGIIPNVGYIYLPLGFLVSSSFLLVSAYLLWNPKLLIGLPNLPLKPPGTDLLSLKTELESDFNVLDIFLREKEAFLNPELTVHELSKATQISPRRISQIISLSDYSNFNDYINQMRIKYAASEIQEGYLSQFSVDALSKTSGFNSKNAFYRAFKKIHGCTPKTYHSNLNSDSSG
ncbi:helix-turn-helix domain-containing protein [Costertonia aggregata]|uniref:Helix-turn-helix domain-containing protein n=1 Tax=Costertonia aggregata TaxID=343403 RepID=A0A7H9APK0_9FLAO|nr:helix-turn-helix domain-containing protein [Costertonia aggregata]QLG45388.1 helix-turn-helix domain-containing protein [Costertonia aggregata]